MRKFIGILFALLITSCATTNNMQTTENNLQDKWELMTLDGKSVSLDKPIVLDLKTPNQITGNAGCNQLNGTYEVENNTQIHFSKLSTTRMMCEEMQMRVEKDLLEMLEMTNNYTIDGDVLSLNVGKRAPLATFHRLSDSEIVGRYWKLIELDGQKVTMADNQEREQYFVLRSDGSMYGFAGCNTFNGTYDLEEDNKRISFADNISTTLQACPDVKVNEQELLKVFSMTDNYTVSDNKLYLNVGRRAPLAVFESVEF